MSDYFNSQDPIEHGELQLIINTPLGAGAHDDTQIMSRRGSDAQRAAVDDVECGGGGREWHHGIEGKRPESKEFATTLPIAPPNLALQEYPIRGL